MPLVRPRQEDELTSGLRRRVYKLIYLLLYHDKANHYFFLNFCSSSTSLTRPSFWLMHILSLFLMSFSTVPVISLIYELFSFIFYRHFSRSSSIFLVIDSYILLRFVKWRFEYLTSMFFKDYSIFSIFLIVSSRVLILIFWRSLIFF